MVVRTNLQVLKRTNAVPKPGDIFVMQLPTGEHLFGRVILADVPQAQAPMPGANLIYIYDRRSATRKPEVSDLRPGRLLIPPIWTNRLPWAHGYFLTIENRPLEKFDLLRQHCFSRVPLGPGKPSTLVDEAGRALAHRTEPCGEWSLASYRWIDDHVSDALGIARVPEE
jgi:hypothetical protein